MNLTKVPPSKALTALKKAILCKHSNSLTIMCEDKMLS